MTRFPFAPADGSPLIVAHRGASDRALENSLAAVSLAAADGADMIEFDVRLSADGVPFVLHDDRTGRTARENLKVASSPAARLRAVRLRNGEPLPPLADVLDAVRGSVPLNIEVKDPGGAAAVLNALDAASYPGPVMLSSSLRGEILAAGALRPGLPCGLVTRRPSSSDLAFCLRHGLASIHPDRRFLTVLRMRRIAAAGVPFLPYTVNDLDTLVRLVDAGAAGVFSDRARDLRLAWTARAAGRTGA